MLVETLAIRIGSRWWRPRAEVRRARIAAGQADLVAGSPEPSVSGSSRDSKHRIDATTKDRRHTADGFVRAGRRLGVALTTSGPGAAETLAAVGQA
jgi:hypothetical protein